MLVSDYQLCRSVVGRRGGWRCMSKYMFCMLKSASQKWTRASQPFWEILGECMLYVHVLLTKQHLTRGSEPWRWSICRQSRSMVIRWWVTAQLGCSESRAAYASWKKQTTKWLCWRSTYRPYTLQELSDWSVDVVPTLRSSQVWIRTWIVSKTRSRGPTSITKKVQCTLTSFQLTYKVYVSMMSYGRFSQ